MSEEFVTIGSHDLPVQKEEKKQEFEVVADGILYTEQEKQNTKKNLLKTNSLKSIVTKNYHLISHLVFFLYSLIVMGIGLGIDNHVLSGFGIMKLFLTPLHYLHHHFSETSSSDHNK